MSLSSPEGDSLVRTKTLLSVSVFLLFALTSLTGCFTSGREFQSDTTWLKEGVTKQDDVKRLLGDPFMVGNSSGTPTSTWAYYRYELFGGSFAKELKVYWNPDHTVRSYNFSSNFADDLDKAKKPTAKTIKK